jgi:catechol 2,3-dioxygenase-like lactoylglutathione lyase family enzyme
MILGLFETHIDVADLDQARRFYGETLGLEFGLLDEARRVAFYWVGSRGDAMLGLWEKPAGEIRPQHFAFRSSVEDVLTRAVPYLRERDLPSRNFLDDGSELPMVFGWMPALAIYFRDPDGHDLEFIAMLPDEPRPEAGVVSWDEWQRLHRREAASDSSTRRSEASSASLPSDRERNAEPAPEEAAQ